MQPASAPLFWAPSCAKMSHIQPQVDTESLKDLSYLMAWNLPIPAELLAKCRRAGHNLLRSDRAAWGWTTLTACAAAEWNLQEAQRLAEQAIGALGPNSVLLCNLSVSFKHLCRPDVAIQYS